MNEITMNRFKVQDKKIRGKVHPGHRAKQYDMLAVNSQDISGVGGNEVR